MWGIWEHEKDELLISQTCANTIHENIEVVSRHSQEEIEFLDVLEDNYKITKDLQMFMKKNLMHTCTFTKNQTVQPTKDKISFPKFQAP